MGYIQSEEHFIHYLRLVLKNNENILDGDRIIQDGNFYINNIYKRGLHNKFTWEVKENPFLLYEENINDFIKENLVRCEYVPDEIFSSKFLAFSDKYMTKYGVYFFENRFKQSLYVGKGAMVGSRSKSSFKEKLKSYDKEVYCKYIICDSMADASVIEVYFISLLNPVYNKESKYNQVLSLKVSGIPKPTKRVIVNK